MAKGYTGREYWSAALNASLCKFLILRTIRWKPMHGYGIIRQLAAQTRNFCVPTQGAVYPVLREFEQCGCVRRRTAVVRGRMRNVYTITAKGRKAYQAGVDVWRNGLRHVQCLLVKYG